MMDTDYCLTCEKHVVGSYPYCSQECENDVSPPASISSGLSSHPKSRDGPRDLIYRHVEALTAAENNYWPVRRPDGILAWAAEIPPGAPAGLGSSSPTQDVCLSSPSMTSLASLRRSPSAYTAPNLLRPHRPIPPMLCMTTPYHAPLPSSLPIMTPQESLSRATSTAAGSPGMNSLFSGASESSVATPASAHPAPISISRKQSMMGSLAVQMRSLIGPSSAIPPPPPLHLLPQASTSKRVDRNDPESLSRTFRPTELEARPSYPVTEDSSSDDPYTAWCSTVLNATLEGKPFKLPRGRTQAVDLPSRYEDHPSFRTRGRKASRAAA